MRCACAVCNGTLRRADSSRKDRTEWEPCTTESMTATGFDWDGSVMVFAREAVRACGFGAKRVVKTGRKKAWRKQCQRQRLEFYDDVGCK